MVAFFEAMWGVFLELIGVVFPVFQTGNYLKIPKPVRWFLHVIFLIILLGVLYYLNDYFGVRFLIQDPRIQPYWLPLFFLLIYSLAWAAWWIWYLLISDADDLPFPDIDEAWNEAKEALDKAGISLQDVPVFLILGRPEAPEDCLFQAAQMSLVLRQVPSSAKSPLHIYANHDGIYLTCAGASLMGKHAANLALEGLSELDDNSPVSAEPDGDVARTLQPNRQESQAMATLAMVQDEGMKALQRRHIRRMLGKRNPELLYKTAEVETLTARLAHLCRLLVRDRQPFCPINGILFLVPLGGTDTESDAQQTAELCYRDFTTIRRVMKTRCPTFAMLCDMESFPGFREFVATHDARARSARVGQRFPLDSPDHQGEQLLKNLDSSVQWLCHRVLRDLVYRKFQVSQDTPEEMSKNKNYFLFLDQLQQRCDHLSRILVNGMARNVNGPLLFGGTYVAATGSDRDTEQAFVRGVVNRLIECQAFVSWTEEAIAEDARSHRTATIGYSALAILAAAVAFLAWRHFFGARG